MTGRATATMSGTRPVAATSVPLLRTEVKLTRLASPPSPGEMRAIELGIERALRASRRPSGASTIEAGWRFSGRWWRPRPAPQGTRRP